MEPVRIDIRRFLWLIPLILINQNLYCQNARTIDSLLTVLETTEPDTSHVVIYLKLHVQFLRSDIDSAIGFAQKGKALAEELGDVKNLVELTYRLGVAYTNSENFLLAEKEFKQSLDISESINSDGDRANVYSGLGKMYYERNEFDQATSFYLKALEMVESIGDRNGEARVMNELGSLYKMQRQNDKALSYYQGALSIVRQLNFKPGISSCLLNIGGVYINEKEFDKALPYLKESLSIKQEIGDRIGESRGLINMGNIHRELKRYDQAQEYYTRALAITEKTSIPRDINALIFNLALNEFERGDYKRSLLYGEQSLERSKAAGDIEMEIKSRGVLAESYAAMGQTEKAYEFARLISALKDSLFDEKIIRTSAELDAKYQNEKKEREISALNSANELTTLQLQKGRTERNYLIVLTLLALLLGSLMWNRYRIKQRSNEKLRELDQAKSRFFANISHEFRTPLSLILGNLQDMAEHTSDIGDDGIRLRVMQKNANRLRQLIEQLLDLSKLESGKLKLNIEYANPGKFLRAVTSSFSSWAEQKSITLSVDIPAEDITACFDREVLQKIIDNLLSNAIKFTPEHCAVSFSAQWNAEELIVQVRDEGPGIPQSKIDQIFERFYQVDDSSTRRQEGSGIGLALVKELVSLHLGSIEVESQPGAGATFKLRVPIHKRNYAASQIQFSNSGQQNGSENIEPTAGPIYPEFEVAVGDHPIILIVEDNTDLGHYIGDHLPDCSVVLASNGVEGLKKAIQHIPDLIISDIMMPEMDGVEFCRKIKVEEKTSHIPVILLTAKADIESRLEGLNTGADDYMTKPFDARELQTRVKNLILQREKLRERFTRNVVLKPKDIAITPPDEIFLEKVMTIIENQLGNSEFSAEDFQKEIGHSRMQLHRKLKALTGHSAGEFMRFQRLLRASEMLLQGYGNISEVCYQTGFSSLSYFAKCFKKQFGVTPKEYVTTHTKSAIDAASDAKIRQE